MKSGKTRDPARGAGRPESQSATLMHRLQAAWSHRAPPPGDGL